jgi:hypothetical protein
MRLLRVSAPPPQPFIYQSFSTMMITDIANFSSIHRLYLYVSVILNTLCYTDRKLGMQTRHSEATEESSQDAEVAFRLWL